MSREKVTIASVIFKPNEKQHQGGRSSGDIILFYKILGESK